jgi:hypothetical protein
VDREARIAQTKRVIVVIRDLLRSPILSRDTLYQVHDLQMILQCELDELQNYELAAD